MLTAVQGRVLGCLVEKERTVPDQYPLTMNALVAACNQSTSRDPVMRVEEHEVAAALAELKVAGWSRVVHPSHGRSVTRYRHVLDEHLELDPEPTVVLAVLLLRGPQTAAELRSRSERMHAFDTVADVEAALATLADRQLVHLLARQPGQKEARWQQLVAEEQPLVAPLVAPMTSAPLTSAPVTSVLERVAEEPGLAERVAQLEERIAKLEAALADLL